MRNKETIADIAHEVSKTNQELAARIRKAECRLVESCLLAKEDAARFGKNLACHRHNMDEQSLIDCGDPTNTYLAYLAMFRYAFGRMTYMPSVVVEIIKRNAKHLTMETLTKLDEELSEERARYFRMNYKRDAIHSSNFGMECDRKMWIEFHEWIKRTIEERKDTQK